MRTYAYLVASALLLSACASGPGSSPSLAKRSYEFADADIARLMEGEVEVPDPTPPEAIALPAQLESRAATAFALHQQGQAAFQTRVANTERVVNDARTAAPDSEEWMAAQMAVSRLDSARAPSITAIGELDSLYVTVIDSLGLDYALSVSPRQEKVAEDVAYQTRVVTALAGVLR